MHLILSLALAFCFQVTLLQAVCNSLQQSIEKVTTETIDLKHVGNSDTNSSSSYKNNTGQFELRPNQTSGTLSNRIDGYKTDVDELDTFRLEYNKYKILSHLSITSNLDDITPRIDEELRSKLLASATIKDSISDHSTTNSRRKRSLTCDQVKNEKSACCLDNFYVNFTHIGWDKWILYPPGYQANYCRGKCDLSHARYYHSTLLSKYSHMITLCCSPKQMAPLSLLYIDEDNKVHQKSIPDMVVESCDCA